MTERVAHYDILERLGGGALGDVYRARDTRVGRTVALVQPPARLLTDEAARARFLDDARIAATLNHPNIAALFDVVEENDRCALAYEFVAGPSLRQEMAGLRLGVRRSLELAAYLADGLAEGHSRGVVHGDLRPETVVLTEKGSIKILSFGMMRWTPDGAARTLAAVSPDSLTADEAPIAAYLTPEEARGARPDGRSDIFALGVLLHEMVTGQHPFRSGTPAATVLNVTGQDPSPASAHSGDAPAALDALLARAMAKEPAARQQSAAVLAADLRALARDLAGAYRAPQTTPVIATGERRRSAWWWIVAAAVVAAAIWWWWS